MTGSQRNSKNNNAFWARVYLFLGVTPEQLAAMSPVKLQTKFAPKLRKLAVQELQFGETVVAQSFRGVYAGFDTGSYVENYAQRRGQAGNWAKATEATVLAELFNVDTVVIGKEVNTVLYRASSETEVSNPKRPLVELVYTPGHWDTRREKSLPNGNCLFNAFALELQKSAIAEVGQQPEVTETLEQTHIEWGKYIEESPTPIEHEQACRAEGERIQELKETDPTQYEQIQSDHCLALQLAIEESKYDRTLSSSEEDAIFAQALRFTLFESQKTAVQEKVVGSSETSSHFSHLQR